MAPTELPLGLLGGTFDPIHFGHLRLAEEAREHLGLGAVRLIPAGQPPHRGTPGAPGADRLAMVRAAVAGNPGFEVDAGEVLSAAPSYTVTTLERLRAELGPHAPLVLLLGADAFAGLARWHRWPDLFALAHLGVATRPGHRLAPEGWPPALAAEWAARQGDAASLRATPGGRIVPFTLTALDISATALRQRAARHASLRYLLPDGVLDYIASHHLYR